MFRRRRGGEASTPDASDEATSTPLGAAEDDGVPAKPPRPHGPYDASEVDLDQARATRVDLGGLLIPAAEGVVWQLQGEVRAGLSPTVVLGDGEGTVQLMAVAAPRSSGWWEQTRLQIAADVQRRGGRADEADSPLGVELRITVPARTSDGKQVLQGSRVTAVDGPRWMLRATFGGRAIPDAAVFQRLVELVREVVVVRGDHPMAPGDVIMLTPPAAEESSRDR